MRTVWRFSEEKAIIAVQNSFGTTLSLQLDSHFSIQANLGKSMKTICLWETTKTVIFINSI